LYNSGDWGNTGNWAGRRIDCQMDVANDDIVCCKVMPECTVGTQWLWKKGPSGSQELFFYNKYYEGSMGGSVR
jgi:hypothetical protein